jgi:hypothetical protein
MEDFQSEDEIVTRRCGCARENPDVCECFAWLQAARAAPERVPIHEEAVNTIGGVERALADMMRTRGPRRAPAGSAHPARPGAGSRPQSAGSGSAHLHVAATARSSVL